MKEGIRFINSISQHEYISSRACKILFMNIRSISETPMLLNWLLNLLLKPICFCWDAHNELYPSLSGSTSTNRTNSRQLKFLTLPILMRTNNHTNMSTFVLIENFHFWNFVQVNNKVQPKKPQKAYNIVQILNDSHLKKMWTRLKFENTWNHLF